MKIIVACDSFKGCMSSKEVEKCIRRGILKANPNHEVFTFPMADGGEGTAMVFCDIIQGKTIDVLTVDAYGKNSLLNIVFHRIQIWLLWMWQAASA